MGIFEMMMIALGLSVDAFAAALCKGLNMCKQNVRHALIIALFFGGFQTIMPVFGWLLGKQFERYITRFDHWIAFGLLICIGGKMIFEAIKNRKNAGDDTDSLRMNELILLAIATSIDAFAVGITFAFLQVSIVPAVTFIGVTTFLLSLVSVWIGCRFGEKLKTKAQITGGLVLMLIGVKILLEHLGVF